MTTVVRKVKNIQYSPVQVRVREATSNSRWGPTGAQMSEIAQMTFNGSNDFYEIMDMLDKRLNDKGKNWRHVLKSLKVLDYCLHEGSELVVTWARKNVYIIKTLREFQYVEEDGQDAGQNVRLSAKELTSLILDEERLRTERADRKSWKSRVTGIDEYGPQGSGLEGVGEGSQGRRSHRQRPQNEDEDLEYKLAIEASKNEMEEEKKRRQSHTNTADDDDLEKALRLSKEEEELRRRDLENQNAQSLFDDTPVASQPTGWNQGYQQGGAVDLFGNPVFQPQQPQSTGFLENAYNQQQFMPQQTGFQNGFPQQQTGFDQMQQPFGQANFMQPQQTAFNATNPYAQQQFQQQQQQEPSGPAAGTNNPWNTNQQDTLKPLPTGSNNPFGAGFGQPKKQTPTSAMLIHAKEPTLSTLAEQRTATQFNQPSSNPIMNFQAQSQPQLHQQNSMPQLQQQPQNVQKPMDPHTAKLNALLASGEGMDTFGNTGETRIPAQHTAPGVFVNSAGQNLQKLHTGAPQGNNPFFSQQQTGVHPAFAPNMPAQTGPGGFAGGNNPFGGQRQNQGGASLIDL